jgi:LPXTG-motif cell wall-anchored protein
VGPKILFLLNGLIAVGYALGFFVAADPLLEAYGVMPNDESVFMARWFGVGLLANGLTTLLARNAAESEAGRAIAAALVVSYGVGVLLALWGTLTGQFNALGWIAVGLNLLLGVGFWFFRFRRSV